MKYPQVNNMEDIPQQLGAFKTYFRRTNPKDEEGQRYINIYIKHSMGIFDP